MHARTSDGMDRDISPVYEYVFFEEIIDVRWSDEMRWKVGF
jgi:hypothetical protein